MQGLEQTAPCPPPPASKTTSPLSSLSCDAKGLGHGAFSLPLGSLPLFSFHSALPCSCLFFSLVQSLQPWDLFCYCRDPLGFPGGSAGKESACNVGNPGSIPGLGRSPREGNDYPLQYSGLENSMDCIVHGVAKSWTQLSNFHFQSFQYTSEFK